MHRITAMWQGKEAEEALNLGAFKEGEFTARMLVESLTGTNCGYCTSTIQLLTEEDALARKDPRIVLIETHYDNLLKCGRNTMNAAGRWRKLLLHISALRVLLRFI